MFAMSRLAPIVALSDALQWAGVLRAEASRCVVEVAALRGRAGRNASLKDQAMRTFADGSADADLRDWAERYLCGMTDKAPEKFREGRRAQA